MSGAGWSRRGLLRQAALRRHGERHGAQHRRGVSGWRGTQPQRGFVRRAGAAGSGCGVELHRHRRLFAGRHGRCGDRCCGRRPRDAELDRRGRTVASGVAYGQLERMCLVVGAERGVVAAGRDARRQRRLPVQRVLHGFAELFDGGRSLLDAGRQRIGRVPVLEMAAGGGEQQRGGLRLAPLPCTLGGVHGTVREGGGQRARLRGGGGRQVPGSRRLRLLGEPMHAAGAAVEQQKRAPLPAGGQGEGLRQPLPRLRVQQPQRPARHTAPVHAPHRALRSDQELSAGGDRERLHAGQLLRRQQRSNRQDLAHAAAAGCGERAQAVLARVERPQRAAAAGGGCGRRQTAERQAHGAGFGAAVAAHDHLP